MGLTIPERHQGDPDPAADVNAIVEEINRIDGELVDLGTVADSAQETATAAAAAAAQALSGSAGIAGGSLTGNYPNPTIAAGAVGAPEILDGSITNAEVSPTAAIALSKLATNPLDRANHTGTQSPATIAGFDTQVRTSRIDQMAAPTAPVALGGQRTTGMADPIGAQDGATKAYVDAVAQGLDPKPSVKVATTAAITLSGTQTIDTVAVVAGDRVLVKNQASAPANGIYVVAAGAWARATDMDTWTEVPGAFTFVESGGQQATGWVASGATGGTIDTTAITWTQFSGAGTVTAGTGLTKTGNTLSVTPGGITGTEVAASIKDPAAGTAGLRTLGTGATQAAAGNDSRVVGALPASGGTMTGPLILSGPPTTALQAATKAYVDSIVPGGGGGTGSSMVFDVVQEFGGNGNDAFNNKTAIDAAIAAASAAGGGVVFFQPGSYRTTGGHILPAGVHILGCDRSPRYYGLAIAPPVSPCRIVQTSGTFAFMFKADVAMRGSSISNIALAGNNVLTTGSAAIHGLDWTAAPDEQGFILQNASITGFTGDGWRGRMSVVRAENFVIAGCRGWGAQPVTSYWTDTYFANGYFVGNLSGNLLMDGDTQSGLVQFNTVRFERSGWDPATNTLSTLGTAGTPGVKIVNARDTTFTNCTTDANSGHGVWLFRAATGGKNVFNITFVGCVFNRDGWGSGGDVAPQDYANVRIEGASSSASVDDVFFIGCSVGYGKPKDDGTGTNFYPLHAVSWSNAFYCQWIGGRVVASTPGNEWDTTSGRWASNWRPVRVLTEHTMVLPAFSSGAQPGPTSGGAIWFCDTTNRIRFLTSSGAVFEVNATAVP
jgi:hypothetical protein